MKVIIVGSAVGDAKALASFQRCKEADLLLNSVPEMKTPTRGPVGGESKKWSG